MSPEDEIAPENLAEALLSDEDESSKGVGM
jgi:hypothetical protein